MRIDKAYVRATRETFDGPVPEKHTFTESLSDQLLKLELVYAMEEYTGIELTDVEFGKIRRLSNVRPMFEKKSRVKRSANGQA